ncbi:C39 family peptidase [Candidatus Pacearchaeota archaeon]|nr:C39 family peptidase [Candidatus Pacearchaeota archaeon]
MKILKFPSLRQTFEYDCGPTALQSVLLYYGIEKRKDEIIDIVGTDRHGTSPQKMVKSIKKFGLKCKHGKLTLRQVEKNLDKKIPVILLIQAWPYIDEPTVDWENEWRHGHYVIAIGYNKKGICFEDPFSFYRSYVTKEELLKRWHDIDARTKKKHLHFGIAVYGKKHAYKPNKIIPIG